ncbi:MAG: dCTP deaminase [Desulfobulbaceae bacterium]|nr:dCTP deaminase [Desulfobulbaceae bacterium]
MELLNKNQLVELLNSGGNNSLFIDPLLDEDQIGSVTIDLRLGYDFFVSILTRNPIVELGTRKNLAHRGLTSYFQETRREIGDRFVLYPNQVVLSTTIEYISLPSNVYADILSRSSYTRLGIHLNTMVQPGFRGCFPLELFNHGNNAIELVVGSRICQARFFRSDQENEYYEAGDDRKYYGDIRPTISKADFDKDLGILEKIKGLS